MKRERSNKKILLTKIFGFEVQSVLVKRNFRKKFNTELGKMKLCKRHIHDLKKRKWRDKKTLRRRFQAVEIIQENIWNFKIVLIICCAII